MRAGAALVVLFALSASGGAFAQTAPSTAPVPQTVLVCIPSTSGAAVAPCDVTGQAMMPSTVTGFVLTPDEYASFQTSSAPWDSNLAAEYFGLGVSTVIGCWLVSFATGLILRAIRG